MKSLPMGYKLRPDGLYEKHCEFMSGRKNTPSTSLRIRWAKALGWQIEPLQHTFCAWSVTDPSGKFIGVFSGIGLERVLPPIDAYTVRMALMGMTEDEWDKLVTLVGKAVGFYENPKEMIFQTLRCPTETLAEIYCEVKGVK